MADVTGNGATLQKLKGKVSRKEENLRSYSHAADQTTKQKNIFFSLCYARLVSTLPSWCVVISGLHDDIFASVNFCLGSRPFEAWTRYQ